MLDWRAVELCAALQSFAPKFTATVEKMPRNLFQIAVFYQPLGECFGYDVPLRRGRLPLLPTLKRCAKECRGDERVNPRIY